MSPDRPAMPQSLWAATASPAPDTMPLDGETDADVVIVGAGFCGLSSALHAAERGAKVVVLEAAEPGFGASGRNGGQVIAGLKLGPDELVARFGPERGERYARFAAGTADFLFDLIARNDIECDARRDGWIQGVHATAALGAVEARARQFQALGIPVRMLDRDEVSRLTGAEGYVAGYLDPRSGALNPLSYARGLARAAIAAGVTIYSASPAQAIKREGNRWRVETPRGAARADQVVLATNGYTDKLWPGLERTIVPVNSYQVATRPLGHNLRKTILSEGHVVSDTRRVLAYFRLDADGRLVMGGRGGARDTSDPQYFSHVIKQLARTFPAAASEPLEFHWAGRVALTLDHLPHLADLAPGVTAAFGFNGRGVAMASAMGAVVAQKVTGTAVNDLDVPVRPARAIPFHALHGPVISALVHLKRFQDAREAGS